MRRSRTAEGEAAIAELDRLEKLWAELDVPVTGRRIWLECYIRAFSSTEPVVVTVEEDEQVVAAACLGRVGGPVVEWTALGHAASDYSMFPAVDDDAARRLATAVAARIRRGRRPWRLRLEQFPVQDPVLAHLRDMFENVDVRAGISAPRLALTEPRHVNQHVSKSARRTHRKGWSGLVRDGHGPAMIRGRDAATVVRLLDQIVELRQSRDREVRGYGDLDHPEFRHFYRLIMVELASAGELELHAVVVGETVIGYTIGFLDGFIYRTWDGRVHSDWTEYSTGRISDLEAIESALADRRFTTLDWMRGDQLYKRSAMTHIVEHQQMHAWSSPLVALGFRVAAGLARRTPGGPRWAGQCALVGSTARRSS